MAIAVIGMAIAYARLKPAALVPKAQSPEPEGFTEWLDAAREKSKEGLSALQAFWQTANRDLELRQFAAYLTKTQPNAWNDLKKQAARVGGAK